VATPLERFFKILSRSLEAIQRRPGAGGSRTLDKTQRAIGIYLTLFINYQWTVNIYFY
jgi:hypothetical protein